MPSPPRARHDLPSAQHPKEVTAMSTLITAHRSTRPADVDWLDATTPCRADDDLELWFAETPAGGEHAHDRGTAVSRITFRSGR